MPLEYIIACNCTFIFSKINCFSYLSYMDGIENKMNFMKKNFKEFLISPFLIPLNTPRYPKGIKGKKWNL